MSTSHRIAELADAQLAAFEDRNLASSVSNHFVDPRQESREWKWPDPKGYSPCWIVADLEDPRQVGIAYSEYGSGQKGNKWGLVFFCDRRLWREFELVPYARAALRRLGLLVASTPDRIAAA